MSSHDNKTIKKTEIVPVAIKVQRMQVGQSGWLFNDAICIIELPHEMPIQYARVIDLEASVFPKIPFEGGVYIKKIAGGNDGDSFMLDFSNVSSTFAILPQDKVDFKKQTTPIIITPDVVNEKSVKLYYPIEDLYEELKTLFDVENYHHNVKQVQELLGVMTQKLHQEYAKYTLVKLFNKYADSCKTLERTKKYLEEEEQEGEYNEDYEYAMAEIQIEEEMQKIIVALLKEKLPTDFSHYTKERQTIICQKINANAYLHEELEEIMYTILNKNGFE